MFGGAWVVDRRIRVNLVKYKSRSNYWRRKHSHGIPQQKAHQNDKKFDNVPATGKTGEGGYPKEADVESSPKLQGMSLDEKPVAEAKTHKEALRRILGHREEESLWKLSKSLIGTMALDCDTEEVKRRLHNWGLGDFVVKKMGSRRFLIESIDDELLNLMEMQQWSLLKEIFLEVCYWSEAFKIPDHTTWVEVVGIPLHCWNYLTFKRIAECWGSLVALGENLNQIQGCEKMALLISTSQMMKIEEVMEIEVGTEVYSVRVFEIYVVKVSSRVQSSCPGKKPDRKISLKMSVNSSESSTTSKQKEKSGNSGDIPIGTDEAINAVCLGKSSHDYANSTDKGASRSLGVPELVGGRFEALSGDNVSARSSLREKGVVSSKNIYVDCSLNVPGPKGDISQTQANPIVAIILFEHLMG
ncbi:hypothetical protein V6N13_033063 [Hibiscus sabdariffa]